MGVDPERIIDEVRELVADGFREITLLGQNVNSYGKDLGTGYDFADLLTDLDKIEGDYLLRFMSSQPKDASHKLFDVMAASRHVAKQLHLPVQSGCDRVLRAMNRPYDVAKYLDLITYARRVMPELVLTSDVIIGFPGETETGCVPCRTASPRSCTASMWGRRCAVWWTARAMTPAGP